VKSVTRKTKTKLTCEVKNSQVSFVFGLPKDSVQKAERKLRYPGE
jgi:hypothetical protein